MHSSIRIAKLFFLALIAGWVFTSVVHAVNEPAPAGEAPTGQSIQIDFPHEQHKDKLDAYLTAKTIPVTTANGTFDLHTSRLKRLQIDQVVNNVPHVAIELVDGSRWTGTTKPGPWSIRVEKQDRKLELVEGLQIKALRPSEGGLLAALLGLLTLTIMEIVLGIDNIIFLAIIAGKLPVEEQPRARRFGLAAALGTRLLLLFSLTWLLGLTKPLFTLPELPFLQDAEARNISWRDLILLVGGGFLIFKSVREMHEKVEHAKKTTTEVPKKVPGFWSVIAQIAVIDIIFSLDSVITAVGMVDQLWVMVTAMLIAVGVMMVFAEPISRFVERHPTIKVLALSFLILIGVLLVAESLGQHIDKGYIYFAMAFAVIVEVINMQLRKHAPADDRHH